MCFEQFPVSVMLCCTAICSAVQINALKQVPAIAFITSFFKIPQNIFHVLYFSHLKFCIFVTFLSSGKSGRDSSVGMATRYGLDGPAIETRWKRDFPQQSNPALRLTQPPIQWLPGPSPVGKAAGAWP
jgi:hypothetical protein